jgi:hypothetical protein
VGVPGSRRLQLALKSDKIGTFANPTRLIPFTISALFFAGREAGRPHPHPTRLFGANSASTASARVRQNDGKSGANVFSASGHIGPILTARRSVRLN